MRPGDLRYVAADAITEDADGQLWAMSRAKTTELSLGDKVGDDAPISILKNSDCFLVVEDTRTAGRRSFGPRDDKPDSPYNLKHCKNHWKCVAGDCDGPGPKKYTWEP